MLLSQLGSLAAGRSRGVRNRYFCFVLIQFRLRIFWFRFG